MERISKKGRTYIKGRAVGSDLRRIVIDDIISAGGCPETAYFPGEFKYVADKFKLSNTTIKNIWVSFCERKTVDPRPHGGGNPSKLSREDLELIEVLITANPTISHTKNCWTNLRNMVMYSARSHDLNCPERFIAE